MLPSFCANNLLRLASASSPSKLNVGEEPTNGSSDTFQRSTHFCCTTSSARQPGSEGHIRARLAPRHGMRCCTNLAPAFFQRCNLFLWAQLPIWEGRWDWLWPQHSSCRITLRGPRWWQRQHHPPLRRQGPDAWREGQGEIPFTQARPARHHNKNKKNHKTAKLAAACSLGRLPPQLPSRLQLARLPITGIGKHKDMASWHHGIMASHPTHEKGMECKRDRVCTVAARRTEPQIYGNLGGR